MSQALELSLEMGSLRLDLDRRLFCPSVVENEFAVVSCCFVLMLIESGGRTNWAV